MADVEATLDACIKCNICTSYCPPAQVTGAFPGPKYAGPQAQRFRSPREPSPDASVDYCNGCRVCNLVCPAGVKIAELNARARASLFRDRGGVPLRERLLGRAELLGRLARPVAPVANLLLHNAASRWAAEVLLGIDRRAPLPRFANRTFREWFSRRGGRAREAAGARFTTGRRKVAYFHGCAANYYEPHVGRAALAVLERNGVEVIVPEQVCCGLPMLSNGDFDPARACFQTNLRHLAPVVEAGYDIVGTSTSCTLTLKAEARELLGDDSEAARLVGEHTYDVCEYLMAMHEAGELDTGFEPLELRVAYHPPCQLNAHRIGHPATELMAIIPGLEVEESGAACCGIAGTYGLKKEKYAVGMAVGRPLFDFVKDSGATVAACDSETCRWQITHATGVRCLHPIELLARAYGLADGQA